jgi:hypothetical protein
MQPVSIEAASTFPPAPDRRLPARESLEASRVALFSGRPDQAYRLLLLAQPDLGSTFDWLDLASRVYLALDRPGRIAEVYFQAGSADPGAPSKMRAVLDRLGAVPSRQVLQPAARLPGLDKRTLKPVLSAVPGPDGSAYLLLEDNLIQVGADGLTKSTRSLLGARDLSLDFSSVPLALGQEEILWGSAVIKLPAEITKPSSAAAAPDGSVFVLDRDEPRLYRLSRKGLSLGSVGVAVGDPARVRVDRAGRIYMVDRGLGQIRVYGADMSPVRTLGLAFAGRPLRKIEDLTVDVAGNMLVLDGGLRRAFLYSGLGQVITFTPETTRVDSAGWDGLNALVILDRKEGVLWRFAT